MSPLLIIVTALIATTPADSWQAFRGTGNSISDAEQLPLKWSDESGIAWKAPLPGYGQSSPVIWQDRVFIRQAPERSMLPSIFFTKFLFKSIDFYIRNQWCVVKGRITEGGNRTKKQRHIAKHVQRV